MDPRIKSGDDDFKDCEKQQEARRIEGPAGKKQEARMAKGPTGKEKTRR